MARGALLDINGVKGGAVLDTFSDSGSFRICGAISKLGQLNCQECQFFNLWGNFGRHHFFKEINGYLVMHHGG